MGWRCILVLALVPVTVYVLVHKGSNFFFLCVPPSILQLFCTLYRLGFFSWLIGDDANLVADTPGLLHSKRGGPM